MEYPFAGSRMMKVSLRHEGVTRLMNKSVQTLLPAFALQGTHCRWAYQGGRSKASHHDDRPTDPCHGTQAQFPDRRGSFWISKLGRHFIQGPRNVFAAITQPSPPAPTSQQVSELSAHEVLEYFPCRNLVLRRTVARLTPTFRQMSSIGSPSSTCFKMNVFCASVNLLAFFASRSLLNQGQTNLNSSSKRPKFQRAEQYQGEGQNGTVFLMTSSQSRTSPHAPRASRWPQKYQAPEPKPNCAQSSERNTWKRPSAF